VSSELLKYRVTNIAKRLGPHKPCKPRAVHIRWHLPAWTAK